ncbi:hypothetical protein NQ315_005084 [Exocentrus adspersus]|uniref:Tyr recombinase domain-containing protein n=1 Tax=Exocentrus adspersus TaxID=1586481 RepID=A0AAV8V504_9CUCU|nr:hypothetical protein NQ315_005084 [Exocentrus adspersus]
MKNFYTEGKDTGENQIEEFLKKAPDVALILGVAGACRCNELTFWISAMSKTKAYLYVLIPIRKQIFQDVSRSWKKLFSVNAVEMCRKYITAGRRFFLRYVDGKCTTQHVGMNTISKIFSKVASFLGLPDPESFTGHGMRRSSATLLANAGVILPLSSVTVVGSRLRLRKIILKNHCPARWQLLKKSRCYLMSAKLWALPVLQKLPMESNLNPGQNNKVVFELNVNVNINNNSK